MLIGDRDRELAAAALRRHFLFGRLSPADLSDRIGIALRARSRADLDVALKDLPFVWEDLPAGLHRLKRRVRRAVLLVVLFGAWVFTSVGLTVGLGIALLAGAPAGTAVAVFLLSWALAGFASWRIWRRS